MNFKSKRNKLNFSSSSSFYLGISSGWPGLAALSPAILLPYLLSPLHRTKGNLSLSPSDSWPTEVAYPRIQFPSLLHLLVQLQLLLHLLLQLQLLLNLVQLHFLQLLIELQLHHLARLLVHNHLHFATPLTPPPPHSTSPPPPPTPPPPPQWSSYNPDWGFRKYDSLTFAGPWKASWRVFPISLLETPSAV